MPQPRRILTLTVPQQLSGVCWVRHASVGYLLLALCGCPLDYSAKNGCVTAIDCGADAGELCIGGRCAAAIGCQSHFECDPTSICQAGNCWPFVSRDYADTLQALAASFCEEQLKACGQSQMQKAYGTNYPEACSAALLSTTSEVGQSNPDQFDPKMAAACVYDVGRLVKEGAERSFTNLPLSCNRMADGPLSEGADCYQRQPDCKFGLACAFGPTRIDGALRDFVCIRAFGAKGDWCANERGQIFTDCDTGLFCDWGESWKCKPRIRAGEDCSAVARCSTPDVVRCQLAVNPCELGFACDLGTKMCKTIEPLCPRVPP